MNRKVSSKNEMTLDDLATIVQSGILDLGSNLKNDIERLGGKIEKIEAEVKEIKSDTKDIKADLNKKVDRFEHNTLVYRVEKLEKKCA